MPSCTNCEQSDQEHKHHKHSKKRDYLLWITIIILLPSYLAYLLFSYSIAQITVIGTFTHSVFELLNKMSWGIALGLLFVGIIGKVPRKLIIGLLGKGGTFQGIIRATLAGTLLDLCSHGILLVGMKLYERGASLGQTMAFLIAIPWNSLSLTLILWALIGLKWTLAFLLLSMLIAIISGIIFDYLEKKGVLPSNPNKTDLPEDFKFFKELHKFLKGIKWQPKGIFILFKSAIKESKMILRWIFLGVVLASLLRTFVSPESFENFFGPSVLGLGLTLIAATILEVCSEGSTPIAADILTRAKAPGNAFAFLMTGVSTDYTEILSLKETTKSWKIAFFLPLVTVPQVIAIALIINFMLT